MKKFKCICYPLQEKYKTTIEAENEEEARIIAEKEAMENVGYQVEITEI